MCFRPIGQFFVSKNKIVLVFLSDRSIFKYLQHVFKIECFRPFLNFNFQKFNDSFWRFKMLFLNCKIFSKLLEKPFGFLSFKFSQNYVAFRIFNCKNCFSKLFLLNKTCSSSNWLVNDYRAC